ncbi:MAG: thiamine-phosphate kinase [Gemmatimonadaceae bacterium]
MTDGDTFLSPRAIQMRTPQENRFEPHVGLGAGAEFDAIRRMLERWGPHAHRIGDDAAVMRSFGDRALIVSTDTSVENVHFRRDWLTPSEIGYRAAAAALSDLAAMGAKPIGMLVAMVIPDNWRDSLDALSDGIGDAAAGSHAPIVGGDLVTGETMSLTFTVLGTARDALLRSGARQGDGIYVTGTLGGPLAALVAFREGSQPLPDHRQRFARPVPRIAEAAYLASEGATSAIDISDGLAGDLSHIAVASRARLVVNLECLPVEPGMSPLDAVTSGEEYELVITSPVAISAERFKSRFGIPITRIGSVEEGEPGVTLLMNGQQVEAPRGYLHFE